MKSKDLKAKTDEDLRILLDDLQEKLRTMKFDLAQGKVKNTAAIRGVRKDIARIETIIRAREMEKIRRGQKYDSQK